MTRLFLTWAAVAAGMGAHAASPDWQTIQMRHDSPQGPYTFSEYIKDFSKDYTVGTQEHGNRERIFRARLAAVVAHNRNPEHSWRKGINHMSDWTDEEYQRQMGYKSNANQQLKYVRTETPALVDELPAEVDWRACSAYGRSPLCPNNDLQTSVVTPVKNQLACGSCYAFASTAVLESHLAINTRLLGDLAPQHIVSCAPNANHCGGTGGCQGSTADVVYQWIHATGGLTSEFAYGYESGLAGKTGTCIDARTKSKSAKVAAVLGKPTSNNYAALASAVLKGPVAVNVYASDWRDYESGIYNGCSYNDEVNINHVVVLEGYGPGYWLIRNSWGPKYGEAGYIRLARESEEHCGIDTRPGDGWDCAPFPSNVTVCGMCGVAYEPTFPTGVTN